MTPMTAAPVPVPAVSYAVAAFAEQEGVTAYLPAVLAMTRRIFPTAPMAVFVEGDPEIADDWHIVLEVKVVGMSAEELFATQWQWSGEVFEHCPSTHVCVFRLGVVAT